MINDILYDSNTFLIDKYIFNSQGIILYITFDNNFYAVLRKKNLYTKSRVIGNV